MHSSTLLRADPAERLRCIAYGKIPKDIASWWRTMASACRKEANGPFPER